MPEFIYQVKNRDGQVMQGVVEAHSESDAVSVLHEKGLVILSLEEKEKGLLKKDIGAALIRPSSSDVVFFREATGHSD